jgi:predicted XRE-type DNA-binding protein
MKTKTERFKSAHDFGAALGLSNVEMEMIRQKKRLIQRLKETRLKKGLSQAEVANLIGSKQPAIARMEAGQVSQVSMDFLLRAAMVLGLSVTIKPGKLAA